MSKTILITARVRDALTGCVEEIVRHGIDLASGRTVAMPDESPQALGAAFDNRIGEWVLDADRPALRMERRAA